MIHTLKREQRLPISLKDAWSFFSAPRNLARITPDWMGFQVRSGAERAMYAGQIITYTVRPLFGIPLSWVTEITHAREPHFFVDEQRVGPFAFWHHQHHFTEREGVVIMADEVNYRVGFGPAGDALNALVIRKRLESIFDYRHRTIATLFRHN